MRFTAWIGKSTGDASARAIAGKVGKSHTVVAKWLREGEMPCYAVLDLARAYDADPIEGLLAAGYLTIEDLMRVGVPAAVKAAPTEMLIEELAARSRAITAARKAGSQWNPPHATGPFGDAWPT
jgi:hypothetical protein